MVRAAPRFGNSFKKQVQRPMFGKRCAANIVRGETAPMSVLSSAIADLQAAKIYRNEQFANLQIRKLAFSTRIGLWFRRNFTTLAHLTCLSVGAWVLLDTTQAASVLLLGISALNLHSKRYNN